MAPASNTDFIFNLKGLIWARQAAGCAGACRWSNHLARIEASAVVGGSQSIWKGAKNAASASYRPHISVRLSACDEEDGQRWWWAESQETPPLHLTFQATGPLEAIGGQLALRTQAWNPPLPNLRRGVESNGHQLTSVGTFLESRREGRELC